MPPSNSEKLAEAPFDDAQADLHLQSSDDVHFRVYKNILSLASPTFTDMFSMPSPPSQKPEEPQVVRLSEHSTALDVALRHIYPVGRPKAADTLHLASILAEFARKYQVEALDMFITGYLTDSVERDPVGVYAIAVTYGYNGIGESAARSCLRLPFSGLQSSYLRCAAAEHISELMRYHAACGEATSFVASSDRTWLSKNGFPRSACRSCTMQDFIPHTSTPHGGPWFHYNSKDDDDEFLDKKFGPRCLWNYLYRSALVLAHHPTAEAVTTEDFVLKTNDCHSCAQSMKGDMLGISLILGGEIKKAIERVSFSLYLLSHVYRRFIVECLHLKGPLTQGCFRGNE